MNRQVGFKAGDLVDVIGRRLTHYGKIIEITDDKAVVHIKATREPKRENCCDDCGWPGFLSMYGNTGEIVCMKSDCGYNHGLEERDEIIPLEKLINITVKRQIEKKEEFLREIHSKLLQAVKNGLINDREVVDVMNTLKTEERK